MDFRLPENTIILGVTCGGQSRVYPLQEVRNEGSVVHDELDGEPILVIAGPYADSFALAAYSRRLNDKVLTFGYDEPAGQYEDEETGSRWNIEGKAVEGELKGSSLEMLDSCYIRWHGWAFGHKQTEIFFSDKKPKVDPAGFAALLEKLEAASYLVELEARIPRLRLPNESVEGLTLFINGDRFNLHAFTSAAAAEDYAFAKAHSLRGGIYVLESDPDDRLKFADKLFTSRKPDDKIPWSSMLDTGPGNVAGKQFVEDFQRLAGGHGDEIGEMKSVYQSLASRDYKLAPQVDKADSIDRGIMAEAYRFQLPVNCLSARPFNIGKEPFMLYKFGSEENAAAYSASIPKNLHSGRFVLRSVPYDMYYDAGFGERPLEDVSWSELLEDALFHEALKSACKGI